MLLLVRVLVVVEAEEQLVALLRRPFVAPVAADEALEVLRPFGVELPGVVEAREALPPLVKS